MSDLECPACHEKTIPVWRKMLLGPATSTVCANCGSRISVPYAAIWTVIPFVIALVASHFAASEAVSVALVVIGLALMGWLSYKFVPLIVKERAEVKA